MNEAALGLSLLFFAGAMNGSFTLPMKFTRKWQWENTWLVWTIFALLIFPPLLAYSTVPELHKVYADAGLAVVLTVAACGAGWGIAQVFFGLAVDALGIALAFSVVLGTSAAIGSMIPLIRLHAEKIATPAGLAVITGVVLVLVGVSICAVAGKKREKVLGAAPAGKASAGRGLVLCVLSGLGSALVNFGVAFGGPILDAAQRHGAPRLWSPNAAFMPLMLAGAIPNLVYCLYLIRKNKTTQRFLVSGTTPYWFLAALMALFWFGSTIMYGASTTTLGQLGAVLAWPLFMSLIVITATVWGVLTGEWKSTGSKPLTIMTGGVAVLVAAIFVLSFASRNM